jgi:hypothetical protein
MAPVKPYRPAGDKFTTQVLVGKEHTHAKIEGALSYTELTYLLASLIGGTSVTTFKPDPFEPDTPKTFTVEVGSSAGANKFVYGLVTDLNLRFTREEASCSGAMIGQALQEGITMTASPVNLAKAPVNPKDVDVYVGDAVGSLTKLARCLEAEVGIKSRWSPGFFFDSTAPSFSTHVEKAPEVSTQVVVEHDSVAAGLMSDLRSAKQKFLRIKANGPEYSTGNPYTLQITMPVFILENDRGDHDSLLGSTFNMVPDYESGFGSAIEVILAHGLSGL